MHTENEDEGTRLFILQIFTSRFNSRFRVRRRGGSVDWRTVLQRSHYDARKLADNSAYEAYLVTRKFPKDEVCGLISQAACSTSELTFGPILRSVTASSYLV